MAERRDEVGHTGVYPGSGPLPEGDADVLTPGDINEGRSGRGHHDRPEDPRPKRLPRKGDELDDLRDHTTD